MEIGAPFAIEACSQTLRLPENDVRIKSPTAPEFRWRARLPILPQKKPEGVEYAHILCLSLSHACPLEFPIPHSCYSYYLLSNPCC
jgi:hypothetical protein